MQAERYKKQHPLMESNHNLTPGQPGSMEADALFPQVIAHLNRIGLSYTRRDAGRTTTLLINFREETGERQAADAARPAGSNP